MEHGKCLIIAEAGVNHNGDVETALRLCNEAKKAGADVIKFQTWITEKIITPTVNLAEYQAKNVGKQQSQFNMLKELELSFEDFRKIKKYCDDIGITFASTADEEESLDFLIDLGIPFIKIGSGDIGNVAFLRYIGTKHLPVILSTGMSSLSDVDMSVAALEEGGADDITLLHCTTNYPCPYEDVNLRAMQTLRDAFHKTVGYSDHTIGIEVSVSAVALGAKVIEKHFTLDRNMAGPDHLASTEPSEFQKLVRAIANVEECLGSGDKRPVKNESELKKFVTKRILAKRDIRMGEVFSPKNLITKRNYKGIPANEWDKIVGRIAARDYSVDEAIEL